MGAVKEAQFSLVILTNEEKDKVLFAEVDGEFADILVSFLTLPLGTIIKILENNYGEEAPCIGSLNTLYDSLKDFDESNFWSETGKMMLLNPKNSFEAHLERLKMNIDDTQPTRYFICDDWGCTLRSDPVNVSIHSTDRCGCGKFMNREIGLKSSSASDNAITGVFTAKTASFIITDDLQIMPNSLGSGLRVLNDLGIEGPPPGFAYRQHVFGLEKVIDLLKLALFSRTPLTDLFLKEDHRDPFTGNPGSGSGSGVLVANDDVHSSSEKMTVKAIVQKSTGAVLLAETREDFVDFLFCLLTMPIGIALSISNGNSPVGSIHNLYRSLANLNHEWSLKTIYPPEKPHLPPGFLSKYHLFPFTEQQLYCQTIYYDKTGVCSGYLTLESLPCYGREKLLHNVKLIDPKGQKNYVKGPSMFMVTDDLKVTPISAISGFGVLKGLEVSVSDIEEYVIHIGIKEASSILKAALFSNTALTDSLMPLLKKKIKQEK